LNNGNKSDDEKICTIREPYGPVNAPKVRSRRHLYNYNTTSNGGNVYFTNPIKRVEDPSVGAFTFWETFIWRLADGVLVEHRDKFDVPTRYTYDSQNRGLVFSKVEPDNGYSEANRTTFYEYDPAGRLILVDAPGIDATQRLRTATAYNAQHSVTRITVDPRTNPVTGNLDWPLGLDLREEFTYTAGGELASQRKGSDAAETFSNFDSYGNPGRETSPGGSVKNFTYNSVGFLIEESPPAPLGPTTTTYDALNRVRSINKAGAVTIYSYSPSGQVTSTTNPSGFVTTYDYDEQGRLESITHPVDSSVANNIVEFMDYDAAGNLVRTTSGKGQTILFEFDRRDLLVRETRADLSTEQWNYDNDGRVLEKIDGKGQKTRMVYSSAGRLVREERLNGAAVAYQTLYTYTPGGELLTIVDPSSPNATTYRYDSASRRIGHYQPVPNKTLFWTLDGSGRRTSLQLFQGNTILGIPLVRWNTTYNADLKRASLTEQLGSGASATLAQFQYNGAGLLSQKSLFNGWSSAYGYTARGEEASIISSQGATIMQWLFWYYSISGLMTQATRTMREGGANRTLITRYTHDRMGRLRSEARTENLPGSQAFTNEYALDKNHNRIWVKRSGVFTYYVVNSMDQHTGGDSFNLGPYDANGSPTRMSFPGQSWTIAWDRDNRPTSFTNHLGAVEAFSYNWRGQRASRTWSGATTTYVYDGDQVIAECFGTNPTYYFVPGVSWTDAVTGMRQAILESLQGSFLTGLLGSGAISSRMEYDAFGMERPLQAGLFPPFRWLGLQTLGQPWLLTWTGDRFYIPRLGRFLTIGPRGPNRYVVGDRSPLRPDITHKLREASIAVVGDRSLLHPDNLSRF
jgi:YD repeat-containing protein